jgi:hypothetical protein
LLVSWSTFWAGHKTLAHPYRATLVERIPPCDGLNLSLESGEKGRFEIAFWQSARVCICLAVRQQGPDCPMHDRKNASGTTIRVHSAPRPFDEPIYVTRPILPPLETYLEHLRAIWTSRQLTNAGPLARALEHHLSAYLEAPHLSLFNNGTAALMTACQALDLSGEVITTPFTFPATPHALNWSRVTPVFADIDPVTMTIDPGRC